MQVGEEEVLPFFAPDGPRFKLGQVDALAGQVGQHLMQGAGLVGHGEKERGLVPGLLFGVLGADDEKPRPVVGQVLDGARQHVQAVHGGQAQVADGGGVRLSSQPRGGGGGGVGGDDLGPGQVGLEPAGALGQGLGVGVDDFHRVQARCRGEQGVADPAGDLGLDEDVVALEVVQALADGALEGIFQRHHAQVGLLAGHGGEHVAYGGLGQEIRGMAQGGHGGEVGERAFGAEVGHPFGALEASGGGQDLAVDGDQMVVGQRSGIGGGEAGQHFLFAEGLEDGAGPAVLAPPDLQAQGGAFVEQGHDLVVHGVDAVANFEQRLLQGTRGDGRLSRVRVHVILP